MTLLADRSVIVFTTSRTRYPGAVMRVSVALLVCGLVSAACAGEEVGGGEPSGGSPFETSTASPSECRGQRVRVEAGSFFFKPERIVVCHHQRLLIENTSNLRHDFTIEGETFPQGQRLRWYIDPGRDVETEVVSSLLDPGIYQVECETHGISNPLTRPVELEIVA